MEKLGKIIIVFGLMIAGFYGFQWWQSSQATETVSHAEIETWTDVEQEKENAPVQPVRSKLAEASEDPPLLMSGDMDQYQTGEDVGRLVIPSIEKGYTMYWGADEETLKQGVGMYVSQWTTTPDQKRHTVVSGHRNTVFTGLDGIEKGDSIFMEYEGQRFEYIVDRMWIADADDRTVIVDKNEATLTLTTCYPFDFIGYAPERYIIQGQLVQIHEM